MGNRRSICETCKDIECYSYSTNPDTECMDYQPKINYNRIISMTPEELARFIRDQIIDRNIGIPAESWLDWLKSPVEDNT